MLSVHRIVAPLFFFFNDPATTEIYTLSLHDALPILSDYGYDNVPQYLKGETNTLNKSVHHYDKFTLENTIKWWQKIAGKRYDKLKESNTLRNDLEIWHQDAEIQIIR